MNVPQILMIALLCISLLVNAHLHGKPKEGLYNFWVGLVSTLITTGLLIWGGFFK